MMTGYFSFSGPLSGFCVNEWVSLKRQGRPICRVGSLLKISESPSGSVIRLYIMSEFAHVKWQHSYHKKIRFGKCSQKWQYIVTSRSKLVSRNTRWNIWLLSQGLDIVDPNIAQISGCSWVQILLHHNYGQSADPSSWSSGNATHAFLYNIPLHMRQIMQVGQFGNHIVMTWSGSDRATFQWHACIWFRP